MSFLRGMILCKFLAAVFSVPQYCLLKIVLAGEDRRAIVGAGAGAVSGSLANYGISNDFVKKLGETIPVNSSALFVLVKSVTEDKVLAEIEPYKPRVLKTSLSNEDEARLKAALSKAA